MTYGQLLVIVVVAPILALSVALFVDQRRRSGAAVCSPWRPIGVTLLALVVLATLYTMPWDDHLIAMGVWWYQPVLLSGIFISHMPVEEVLFFPLQTILVGLWWIWLATHAAWLDIEVPTRVRSWRRSVSGRLAVCAMGAALWLGALVLLRAEWRPETYLGWELAWALPPLLLQLLVGGDTLWRQWRLVGASVASAALYLSGVDTLALHVGIWTIDPHQSLGILLYGQLPLEELVFFLVTSALVVCGLTLGASPEVQRRIRMLPTGVSAFFDGQPTSRRNAI
jgi:lycopene cyclase domain-containing protein